MPNKNIKTIEVTESDVRMTEIAAKALPAAVALMDARGINPTKEQLTALSKRLSRASEFIGGAVPDNVHPADLEVLAKEAASFVVDELWGMDRALS